MTKKSLEWYVEGRKRGENMIIDGYDENPYPFEVGDILRERENQEIAVVCGANYAYVHLGYLTGHFATGRTVDCRLEASLEEYEKIGHLQVTCLPLLFEGVRVTP